MLLSPGRRRLGADALRVLQAPLVRWPLLQKSNDVGNAASLCRLAWQPAAGKVGDTPLSKG